MTFAETGVERDVSCLGLYPSLDKVLRRQADYVVKCIRGQEIIVTTVPRRNAKTGQKIGEVKQETKSKVVKLIFDEEVVNVETSTMDTVKNKIEMPSTLVIPESRRHEAFSIIDEAFEAACVVQAKKHKARFGENA